MRPDKRAPCHRALSAGRDACRLQDARNRRPAHVVTHVLQGALHARVAPGRILRRHPHHERTNACLQPGAATACAAVHPFCAPPGATGEWCRASRGSQRGSTAGVLSDGRVPRDTDARAHADVVVGLQDATSARFSSRRNAITSSCVHAAAPRIASPRGIETETRREVYFRRADPLLGHCAVAPKSTQSSR
jgi:hypothetical protein